MLYAYSIDAQTVPTNGNVLFNTIDFDTNCSITGSANSTGISLNKAGFYKVAFSADVVATDANTTGLVQTELNTNGTLYAGALSSTNSGATTDIENLSFTVGVHVKPNCCQVTNNVPTVITFENTGIPAIYSNVNVTVEKVC